MAQGLPRAIAAALLAAGLVHCSLIAPSDQELMGGNKGGGSSSGGGDSGIRDAGDAGDAFEEGPEPGEAGCLMAGQRCSSTSQCCTGLFCTGHSCR
ncbi:MAG TPA: hypothetical protein VF765_06730 [Polyangiaceae bacterium]